MRVGSNTAERALSGRGRQRVILVGVANRSRTAFVLGGGGILGAAEVGMLRALFEHHVMPDVIVGSSVGALNGAFIAADPSTATIDRMTKTWSSLSRGGVFGGSVVGRLTTLARNGTHLHSNEGLRLLIDDGIGDLQFSDLAVQFECVAAGIEQAAAHWFSTGSVTEAILASCAVPGLLPAVEIEGKHYLDGGLVRSIPVGRAVDLGATEIFVLHVGRLEQPLRPPTRPWEVALVSFEISRRHQFAEELARLPEGVAVHVLPTGSTTPSMTVRYRSRPDVPGRIDAAYRASTAALDTLLDAGFPP